MKDNTQNVTLAEIVRPLMQFLVRLIGKDGRFWLEAFKRFLRKENPWIISNRWEIVLLAKVGLRKTIPELVASLTDKGFKIFYSDTTPLNLLKNSPEEITFNPTEEEVYFTFASPKDLGLKPGWTLREFLDASMISGLTPCLSGDILEIIDQGKDLKYVLEKFGRKDF